MPTVTDDTSSYSATWREWVGGIVIANAVFIGMEYMVYRALAPLEGGQPADAAVWAPIAIIYELFGFTTAMAAVPALWLLAMTIIGWQTRARIKRERNQSAQSRPSGADSN